ncbi:hypothetical protein [Acetobacter persici]|uniref:hypothetical protein n=1 Tax=Acetobacter persici TaxID=1076596 RepID=UPI0012FE1E4F|nr:hypothetical protein [Acetobacter persici]
MGCPLVVGGGWWVVGCGEVWDGQAGWNVAGSGVGGLAGVGRSLAWAGGVKCGGVWCGGLAGVGRGLAWMDGVGCDALGCAMGARCLWEWGCG